MRELLPYIALIAAFSAGPAVGGPLTDAFLESLDGVGTAEWSDGVQEGRTETLSNVVLRMNDGTRFDIETLSFDYVAKSVKVSAANVRMNPQGDILLWQIADIDYVGSIEHLESLWGLGSFNDACKVVGPGSTLHMKGIGVVTAGPGGAFSQDNQYRASDASIKLESAGSTQNCVADLSLLVDNFEAKYHDGSSTIFRKVVFDAQLPGNLDSLRTDPQQIVSMALSVEQAAHLISGGATAWAIGDGYFTGSFNALGSVPAITLALIQKGQPRGPAYWMRTWNSLANLEGDFTSLAKNVTIRTSNVIMTENVKKFANAGLTTILLDAEIGLSFDKGDLYLGGEIQTTGLIDAKIDTDLRMGTYPDAAIERAGRSNEPMDEVLPVYVDRLLYEQADDGFFNAAGAILGVPVTVWINQVRDDLVKTYGGSAIGEIATAAANFASLSVRQPPARVNMSLIPELDLRQALIISRRAPSEILNIFKFEVEVDAGAD